VLHAVDRSFGIRLAMAAENTVLGLGGARSLAPDAMELPLYDLPVAHPACGAFVRRQAWPDALSVPRFDGGDPARCFHNVFAVVAAHGGELVPGWLLELVPGILARARHHAVWRDAEGRLFDVTSPGRSPDDGTSTFVPDEANVLDFVDSVPVEDRFLTLIQDSDLRATLVQYRHYIEAQRRLLARLVADFRYDTVPGAGLQGPPLSETYPELLHAMNSTCSRMHRFRGRVLKRYFGSKANNQSPDRRQETFLSDKHRSIDSAK
jgi:hypothetical protein